MLNYLVQSTEQLATLMIMAGLILAYVHMAYPGRGEMILKLGGLAGLFSALIMTYLKTTTSKINTGTWNLRIYAVTLGVLLLFLLCTLLGKWQKKIASWVSPILLSIELAMLMLYYLPAFFEMPHTILLTEDTIMSTAFIVKVLGLLFGGLLTLLMGISMYQGACRVKKHVALGLMLATLFVNAFKQVASAFGILLAKRIIPTNHTLFSISKYASNLSSWFVYLTILMGAAVPVYLLLRSFHVQEPYENHAQRRKILAKWRRNRRWSLVYLLCFLLVAVNMTAVKAYANRKIELSPIEEAVIEDGNVIVPFELVNDGHLHRFGYTADSGVVIRFIVIQKPNSSAFGVGLDACEICGETGYYEKEGQIVCNLCDVVMNINTIGFKGGCNPIVITYSIANGNIVVPIEGLLEYESEFD